MTGGRVGLLSLRLDAAYCLAVGAILAMAAPYVAPSVSLPTEVTAAIGFVVIVWAGAIGWMAVHLPLRVALRIVMAANLAAAVGVAAFSIVASGLFVVLAMVTVAVDVGLFACSQAVALTRLRG